MVLFLFMIISSLISIVFFKNKTAYLKPSKIKVSDEVK